MKRILLTFLLLATPLLAQGPSAPPSGAAYISDGAGGWTPATTTATAGAVTFAPPPVGLYCYNSSLAPATPWVPADSSCFGGGGGGSGTVTTFSAGILSPLFTTSVANPTSTPALSFSLSSTSQNFVLAGPTSGPGAWTARLLASGDIPNNAANTSGNAGTATALALNPSICGAGFAPRGVLADGTATGCQAVGGSVTGTGTANTLAKFTAAGVIGNSQTTDDGTNPIISPHGFNVSTSGGYDYTVANSGAPGTVAQTMACDDGTGKAVVCPAATSTTNVPIGFTVSGAGTTGNSVQCNLGWCTVLFDNATTARHYAIGSTTVAGELHDNGTTLTAGQSNFFIWSANSGAGTAGQIRMLIADDYNNASPTAVYALKVNATALTAGDTVTFSSTVPAAPASTINAAFATSKTGAVDSVSASIPFATSAAKGVVQTDGSTISDTAGVISCTTATTGQLGCVRPDGTTVTISGGVISASGGGGSGISGLTTGFIPLAGSATTLTANSHIDDGVTTAGVLTATEPITENAATLPTQIAMTFNTGHALAPAAGSAIIGPDSTGNLLASENNGAAARVCTATNAVCSGSSGISGLTTGQVAIAGSATTITSSIALGNTGSDIPQLSSGLLSPAVLPVATTGAFGAVKPDGTTITISAGVISASGGGSLPSATAAGQIIASTAAGTTYAAQPLIFYSQSGDTISSIETECSSACTYVVTQPQTITLGASHVLNANVNPVFYADGSWTINGSTFILTIPGQVSGTLTQHFIPGSGSLTLGAANSLVPVEWFGAIGDWNGSTGTDNTTAIQNAINAISAGQVLLQAKGYKTTSALSITKASVGVAGTSQGVAGLGGSPSYIITTSASADVLDVAGASFAAALTWNKFTDFAVQRSTPPTGTATGFSATWVHGMIMNHVQSMDSVRDFYLFQTEADGVGSIDNSTATWGYNGVTDTGTLYGWYLDGTSTNGFRSMRLNYDTTYSNLSSTPVTYGFYLTGNQLSDVMADHLETANVSHGIYVNYTGSGGGVQDVHFNNTISDQSTVDCISVHNVAESLVPSVTFIGGWCADPSGSLGADIESSWGVTISGMQFQSATTTGSILANSSGNVVLSGNNISAYQNSYAIKLNATVNSAVTDNTIIGGAGSGTLIQLAGSSSNAVTGNTIGGAASVGIAYDSSSNNNPSAQNNAFYFGNGLTTAFTDSGAGNQNQRFGTTGSIGGSLLTAGTCASGTATVAGAVVGKTVGVSASDGTLPNALAALSASVTSTNTVTVQVCAIAAVTPTAKTYNVTTY